ncbi:MAG: leucine-rich repeat protein [Ruminococcus sp.]|nr:leucine-rich repeat protein [Ruminococcus sp.]
MKRIVRVFAITLIAIMLSAVAVHAVDSYFELDGFAFDFSEQGEAVIRAYDGDLDAVVIPKTLLRAPVVGIGDYAFYGANITSVGFENATELRAIGSCAFYGCSGLTELELPAWVTQLDFGAFQSCGSLTQVAVGDGVTEIPDQCFYSCGSLSKVTIPRSCTLIADNAFDRSPNVTIYCYRNSAAHLYAVDKGIDYVLLDATDLSAATVTLDAYALRYNSAEQTPRATVILDGVTLDPAADYSVEYADNREAGVATAQVIGKREYKGSVSVQFEIKNVLGDIDGNGEVDSIDATLLQRYLSLMTIPYADRAELVGDVSDDGLDIVDVTFIQRYLSQMPVPFPVDEMM